MARYLVFLVVLVNSGNYATAQGLGLDVVAANKADANAYRILFRQATKYKRMSDDAKASGEDKSYLRRIMARRLDLSEADAESLERISVACDGELAPIQLQIVSAIAAAHARYSQSVGGGSVDRTPPPVLGDLQSQSDVIVLHYRDLLRNSMKEADFQNAQDAVRKTFGGFPHNQ